MKLLKTTLIAICLLTVGFAFGYLVRGVRANPATLVREHPGISGRSYSTATLYPPDHPKFTRQAFEEISSESQSILEEVVGRSASSYQLYVLPSYGGFELDLHWATDGQALNDVQQQQLYTRVSSRLAELSASEAP